MNKKLERMLKTASIGRQIEANPNSSMIFPGVSKIEICAQRI